MINFNYGCINIRRYDETVTNRKTGLQTTGNKELFKGTYAYDNWDFSKKSNVIKLDMSSVDVKSPERLEESLVIMIKNIEEEYNLLPNNIKSPHTSFKELIKKTLRK